MERKSDKQKLMEYLEYCSDAHSLEDIVTGYMEYCSHDFTAFRTLSFIARIIGILEYQVNDLEIARCIAKERATYLKTYLEGGMYTTEEAARKAIPVQIENAQAIINACDMR